MNCPACATRLVFAPSGALDTPKLAVETGARESAGQGLTDTELAEIEAQLVAVAHGPWNWDSMPGQETVAAVFAELRRLRGMRCETCGEWFRNKPQDGAASNVVCTTKPDFGCNQWIPR